jgi:hypothetical protein
LDNVGRMIESFEPSWLSLLPALVTIGLAFLMQQRIIDSSCIGATADR